MKAFLHLLSGVLCALAAYVAIFHLYPLGLDEAVMWLIVGTAGLLGLIFGPLLFEGIALVL